MPNVLQELYVDIISRGMEKAREGVNSLRRQMEDGTKTARQYKQAVQDADSRRYATNIDPSINRTSARSSVTTAVQASRSVGASSGGGAAGLMSTATATRAMTGAVGLATAAVTAFTASMLRGLQGTVELERFNRGMALLSREVANTVGPALRWLGDSVQNVVATFRQMGGAGQVILGLLPGLGLFFNSLAVLQTVFTDPAMMGALGELKAAFVELSIAAKPLVNQLAFFATELIKAGIVTPLVRFTTMLTYAVQALTLFADAASQAMRAVGLGGTLRDRTPRNELRLNQTGTEDAQGTFARIQEAVLRAAMPEEETDSEKQVNLLEKLISVAMDIRGILDKPKEFIDEVKDAPSKFAAGSNLAFGVLGGLFRK